jgi:hypothetical protein
VGPGIFFEITPIHVQGNTERRLVNRKKTSTTLNTVFDAVQLRQDAIALGANNGPAKYRFAVVMNNGAQTSGETKTRTINIK